MKKIIFYLYIFFILTDGIVFAAGNQQTVPDISSPPVQVAQVRTEQVSAEQTRAEQVVKALAQAYPRQIERAEFRNNDWAVLLRGKWYYYAGGRMLPENMLTNAANYSPQPFYNYHAELPPWRTPSQEESARLRNMSNTRRQNPPRRPPYFFDDLWRAHNRNEAYDRVKTIRFLGNPVTVHFLILENLSLVEEQILSAARTSTQVQTWINNIASLDGWSWRDIAETQSRSYHSYGLAIDIIPRSYGGREAYWIWTSNHRPDWWNISYNERYHPPQAVIKAFETYGFIWGGKWLYYDTIHFEYRPEVLLLNGMPPETSR
jgi:hypothetical protein